MKPYLQLAEDASKEDDGIVANLIKMGILVEADMSSEVAISETPEGKRIGEWRLFAPKEDEVDGLDILLGFKSVFRASSRYAPTRLPPGTYTLYQQ